jgi:hypothetical protein
MSSSKGTEEGWEKKMHEEEQGAVSNEPLLQL